MTFLNRRTWCFWEAGKPRWMTDGWGKFRLSSQTRSASQWTPKCKKVMVSINFSKCCSIALSVFNKEDVSSWQSSDPDLWPAACVGLELIRVSHTVNHCSVNNRGTKCCLCHWRWACFSKRPTSMHHLEGKNATGCPLVMVSGWHFESCTHVKCGWCNVFHHPRSILSFLFQH